MAKKHTAQPIRHEASPYPIAFLDMQLSSFRTMIEDQLGRIWFGTQSDGIVIWDGNNIIRLTIENGCWVILLTVF